MLHFSEFIFYFYFKRMSDIQLHDSLLVFISDAPRLELIALLAMAGFLIAFSLVLNCTHGPFFHNELAHRHFHTKLARCNSRKIL